MEQCLDDNMYVVDLGEVNSAPEIIFELSSVLETAEAKNKRICLKLGDVSLNQAQILSIKSLINGIDSTLSSIDTKSAETEKVALSLGLIVSNVLPENSTDTVPAEPYKSAEELKEEQNVQDPYEIVEESDIAPEDSQNPEQEIVETSENQVQDNTEPQADENQENVNENENVKDELDVIFGSGAIQPNIFDAEFKNEEYSTNEELEDIVVPEEEYTKEDMEIEAFPTKYIKQTIRSGQVINYEGNIVIIGDCHPGCEITAFGDITVWGVLSGIAHAGSAGNQKARVRALKMNAIQLRIANCYSRRPDALNTVYIEKTDSYTPEEARIVNDEIVVFKIND